MKMKRLIALVCILLLSAGMVPFGSAEKAVMMQDEKGVEFNYNPSWVYLVRNGETAKFILLANSWGLNTMDGEQYNDLDFDCDGNVKGKVLSGSSWIKVINKRGDCVIRIAANKKAKKRTGKVLVTGENYSATIIFTQWGKSSLTSVKRNKKTVTIKLQKGTGPAEPDHYWLQIREYEKGNDGWTRERDIYNNPYWGDSYKFKVKQNCEYRIYYGPIISHSDGGGTATFEVQYWFTVNSVTGSENYPVY